MIHNPKGFTLVELMMVVVIGGVLTVMAFPAVSSQLKNTKLKKEMKTIAYSLQLLRIRAISANANAYMEFDEGNGCWTAYVDSDGGSDHDADETDEAKLKFEDSCTVDDGTFDGTALNSDVSFGCAGGASCSNVVSFSDDTAGFKPSGLPYQAGTIYLTNTVGTSYQIVVSSGTGRIRTCAWTGSAWKKFNGDSCD